ncbi:MAG: insulinase family protein [Candidatus Pacebacteria bacterium]|nr:insulinase family protein [Candidatus Paceibacterota bacterium]MCF7857062.1 insulinase family protein [Candidatus Paceibacterota bacterium]
MHTTSKQTNGVSAVRIIRDNERLAVCKISIPNKDAHSPKNDVLRTIYSELLLSGSKDFSRETLHDALAKLGSEICVHADAKNISISLDALDITLTKTLKILTNVIIFPTFKDSELKQVKEHLINSLVLEKENARSRAHQQFVSALTSVDDFRHPFSIDTLISEVAQINRDDIKAFHTSLWRQNWLLTSGGTDKTCATIENIVINIRRCDDTQVMEAPIKLTGLSVSRCTLSLIDIPHRQNIEFSIGNVLPLFRSDPDFPAFSFGFNVLALPGFSGRLMSTVRAKEGLTYSIYGYIESCTLSEQGFWRIVTFFSPKDVEKGIMSTTREITRMCEKGMSNDELRRFKAILHTRFVLAEDSLLKKVSEAHSLSLIGFSQQDFTKYKQDIENMTVAKVNTAMKKYLSPKAIVFSGAGPTQSITKVLKKAISRI